MSTYSELVYMVLDKLKLTSNDASFTEDHIVFLLNKYRVLLLKQRYADIKKQIPESNYQTICLELIQVPAISGEPCEGGTYLRSKEKIPNLMKIGNVNVYPLDYYQGDISYISRERMKYVGFTKYTKNTIYCSLGPDSYLYFKSSNPQHLYLENVCMVGIFEDASKATSLGENSNCDFLDNEFPIEGALVPVLIEMVYNSLINDVYRPKDDINNDKDDLSGISVKK